MKYAKVAGVALLAFTSVSTLSVNACVSEQLKKTKAELSYAQQQIATLKHGTTAKPGATQQELDQAFGSEILKFMQVVGSPLSKVERMVTAQLLVNVGNTMFDTYEQKINWITLLAIESKFVSSAKSHAGARGLGQVMPQFAAEFGAKCGLDGVTAKDLDNPIVNATISACQFRHLVETLDGNIPLALAAYNAGQFSTTVKDLQKLRSINSETSNYISRFYYLKNAVNATPTPAATPTAVPTAEEESE